MLARVRAIGKRPPMASSMRIAFRGRARGILDAAEDEHGETPGSSWRGLRAFARRSDGRRRWRRRGVHGFLNATDARRSVALG